MTSPKALSAELVASWDPKIRTRDPAELLAALPYQHWAPHGCSGCSLWQLHAAKKTSQAHLVLPRQSLRQLSKEALDVRTHLTGCKAFDSVNRKARSIVQYYVESHSHGGGQVHC